MTAPHSASPLLERLRAALAGARASPQPFYQVVLTPPGAAQRGEIVLTRFFLTEADDGALAAALHRLAITKLATMGIDSAGIEASAVLLRPDTSPPGPGPDDCRVQAEAARWQAERAEDRSVRDGYLALADRWARLSGSDAERE